MKNSIIPLLIVILLAIGGVFLIMRYQGTTVVQEPGENGTEEEEPGLTDEVFVALLDNERVSDSNIERGCDLVVFASQPVTPTTAPLTAAMNALFGIQNAEVDGYYNFIANTRDTLSFDQAVVENGVARIYLEGELSGLAGVCDNPRAQIQIEETALIFDTVSSVEIYLNGELADLTPSEQ